MDQNTNPVPPDTGGPYLNEEQITQPPVSDPFPERRSGFAIASLVLGIISLFGPCLCCVHVITAPLAIILGAVSLIKKLDGKGMSITGVTLGILSVLMTVMLLISLRPVLEHIDVISEDLLQLTEDQDEVFPAYEKDGTLPDYIRKYLEPPYSDMLAEYDITIYDVMDALLSQYKSGRLMRIDKEAPVSEPEADTTELAALALIPVS